MATRPYYYVEKLSVRKRNVDFTWYPGFAVCQKQKSIASLHEAMGVKALEISTKSTVELGKKLSAFKLKIGGYTVENVYQAGKVFEKGGPFIELLNCSPKEAKRSNLLQNSGKRIGYYDWISKEYWKIDEPFYDYIYVSAVKSSLGKDELKLLSTYDGFTDIESNPKTARNTQARSVAIVKLIYEICGEIPELEKKDFINFVKLFVNEK